MTDTLTLIIPKEKYYRPIGLGGLFLLAKALGYIYVPLRDGYRIGIILCLPFMFFVWIQGIVGYFRPSQLVLSRAGYQLHRWLGSRSYRWEEVARLRLYSQDVYGQTMKYIAHDVVGPQRASLHVRWLHLWRQPDEVLGTGFASSADELLALMNRYRGVVQVA